VTIQAVLHLEVTSLRRYPLLTPVSRKKLQIGQCVMHMKLGMLSQNLMVLQLHP